MRFRHIDHREALERFSGVAFLAGATNMIEHYPQDLAGLSLDGATELLNEIDRTFRGKTRFGVLKIVFGTVFLYDQEMVIEVEVGVWGKNGSWQRINGADFLEKLPRPAVLQ